MRAVVSFFGLIFNIRPESFSGWLASGFGNSGDVLLKPNTPFSDRVAGFALMSVFFVISDLWSVSHWG